MNLLSLLSAMLATAFLIGGIYCLTRNRKSLLNLFSCMVLITLGVWSFFNAFFFSAETTEELWLWHHLSTMGWSGFIAETTCYFIVLTGNQKKYSKPWIQLGLFTVPTVLFVYNLFGERTSLAEGFVRSEIGGQWTYVNSIDNPWLWIYLACLVVHFGLSFYLLLRWAKSVKHKLKKIMAVSFVILDAVTILFGFVTDVLFPLTTPLIPAVANLGTAIFGAGYFFFIIRYDMFNLHLVVSDRELIEHSTDSVLLIDEMGEILYSNPAVSELLRIENRKLLGKNMRDIVGVEQYDLKIGSVLENSDTLNNGELKLYLADGSEMRILAAASVIRDKENEYLGTVVSLRDITLLSRLKEQYRIQSNLYERLAFTDALTGLPNRRRTFDVLNEYAKSFDKNGKDFFLLYTDMDHFKSVNDRFGHEAGDRFLIEITARLKYCITDNLKFLGRLSGDEMLIIGDEDVSDEAISKCISRIQKVFELEFNIGGYVFKSSISIGSARYSDLRDINKMVKHADGQMYEVKQKNHANCIL